MESVALMSKEFLCDGREAGNPLITMRPQPALPLAAVPAGISGDGGSPPSQLTAASGNSSSSWMQLSQWRLPAASAACSLEFYPPGPLLATLSTKVHCWASSALSKCALHRAVFRRRAGCYIPGGHEWSCSLWLCCDLSAFFLLPASREAMD